MLHRTPLALAASFPLLLLLPACESSGETSSSTGGGGAAAGGSTTSAGGGGTAGGSGGAPSTSSSGGSTSSAGGSTSSTGGGGAAPIPHCTPSCQSTADCAADSGAFSADNYACDGGACVYLGCKANDECVTSLIDPAYVCGDALGSSFPRCVMGCQAASDCKLDAGAYDTDNYLCQDQACLFQGCKTDAECATSFSNPAYVCFDDPTYPIPYCVKGCQTSADCKVDSGAYDADNYTCEGGGCLYIGCTTNGECATSFNDPGYVCDGG